MKGYVKSGVSAGSGDNKNIFNNGSHSENSNCNYHSSFNGTSSAAPTVSGVIALILEANPSLTWRDVKHILATTSIQIDASNSKAYLGVNQYSWITNAANYKHHNWYGFGKINAAAAVSAAQTYTAGSLGTWVGTGFVESGALNAAFNSFSRTTMNGDNDLVVAAPAGSSGIVEFVRIGNAIGIEAFEVKQICERWMKEELLLAIKETEKEFFSDSDENYYQLSSDSDENYYK